MKAAEIQRAPLPAAEEVAVLSAELAAKANKLLNYYPSTVRVTGTLTQMLRKAQIEPLNRTQVNAYKASKTRKSLTNHAKLWLIWLGTIALTMATFIAAHTSGRWWGASGIAAIGITFVLFLYSEMSNKKWIASEWHAMPIAHFNGYVPEFALAKAVALRELSPSVSIMVDTLQTQHHELPDPFLIVSMGKEEYYIDVWDEPDFERQTRG